MGYDIAVFEGPMPATNAEAMDALDAFAGLLEGEPTPPTPRLQAFLDELKVRWPGDADEEFDTSPWKAWPLEMDASGPLLYTSLRWSEAEAAIEIADIAIRHGLVVVDPQSETLVNEHDEPRPRLFSRWRRKQAD
jgi:hypothetical protein